MILSSPLGQRVAITGANGFVGRHLLSRLPHDTEVFSLGRRPVESDRPHHHFRLLNLEKSDSIRAVIEEIQPQIVFHLATSRAETNWRDMNAVNIDASMALLEACAQVGVEQLITIGSSLELLPQPKSAYAASRLASALMIRYHARVLDQSMVHIRTGNLYGPGMPARKLIPLAAEAARTGMVLPITCDNIRRNYVYVGDLVDAALRVAYQKDISAEIIDVLSPQVHSARGVCDAVSTCLGRHIATDFRPDMARDWDNHDWDMVGAGIDGAQDCIARTSLLEGIKYMYHSDFELGK